MENESEGKAEKNFKQFGKRVDEFVSEMEEAAEKLRIEFEKRYEELKQSGEHLKKEMENKDRWKEVEASLKRAGDELSQAFKAAFRKKES